MQIQKILILGAGAVGQVIGSHLRISGCEVSFWVRPTQAEALQSQGFRLHNVSTETELHLAAPRILTEIPAEESFDALFLCVRGDQLDPAIAQIKARFQHAENMLLISFQPGREDALKIFRALPELILIPAAPAFSALLENGKTEYWAPKSLPTLVGAPFNETLQVRDQIVHLLQRSGLPARAVNDFEAEVRFPGVALQCLIAAFLLADKSFQKLARHQKLLALTAAAIREATAITARDLGFLPLRYQLFAHCSAAGLAQLLWGLQQLAVKDFLQRMWSAHASKIETQNYQALKDLLELSAQQTRQAPAALTALVAMTPTRIDDYLKTQTSIPSGNTSQRWKTGLLAGAGALFFWKLLMRKKRG